MSKFALVSKATGRPVSFHRLASAAGRESRKRVYADMRVELHERYPDGAYRLSQDELAHNDFDRARNA